MLIAAPRTEVTALSLKLSRSDARTSTSPSQTAVTSASLSVSLSGNVSVIWRLSPAASVTSSAPATNARPCAVRAK